MSEVILVEEINPLLFDSTISKLKDTFGGRVYHSVGKKNTPSRHYLTTHSDKPWTIRHLVWEITYSKQYEHSSNVSRLTKVHQAHELAGYIYLMELIKFNL